MPQVEIIGIHPLQVSQELYERALRDKYGYYDVSSAAEYPEYAQDAVREELESAVLIEACIKDCDQRLQMSDFCQGDQVAYEDVLLSPDGQEVVERWPRKIMARDVRVAFWLHYYNPQQTIGTSYGPVQAPAPTPVPDRLAKLMEYVPVD